MAVKRKSEEKKKRTVPDVNRDELGRFARKREELELRSDRCIKLRKVKGSYGSYVIKERWFSDEERERILSITLVAGSLLLLNVWMILRMM